MTRLVAFADQIRFRANRARAILRTYRKISLTRFSFGLVLLRWFVFILSLLLFVFDPNKFEHNPFLAALLFFGIYCLFLTINAKLVHRICLKFWLALSIADSMFFLLLIYFTDPAFTPFFLLLLVPVLTIAIYSQKRVRFCTLTFTFTILCVYTLMTFIYYRFQNIPLMMLMDRLLLIFFAGIAAAFNGVLLQSHEQFYEVYHKLNVDSSVDPDSIDVSRSVNLEIERLNFARKIIMAFLGSKTKATALKKIQDLIKGVPTHEELTISEKKADALQVLSKEQAEELLGNLQPRHKKVLRLRALGYRYKEIATKLDIKYSTVKTYIDEMSDLIDLRDSSDLTIFAILTGLITNRELKDFSKEKLQKLLD